MAKKDLYVTVDTETCTLPFINEWKLNEKDKQKIAIAKPLVYDLGWTVTDRLGNILKSVNYLIQETFFVPNVFNTAYYKDKRPLYMEKLEKGEISTKTWNEAITELIADMGSAKMTCAYNATFDFKKAIPFTETYIKHLYSNDYNLWEIQQKRKCENILKGTDDSKNPTYLEPYATIRDIDYPLCDLWGLACERLINIDKYRNYCLDNKLVTNSVQFFKTSAETSFQYLMNQHDFIEEHTALSDAIIESQILAKALKKGKIEPTIQEFPFRKLGTTFDYVQNKKPKYKNMIAELLEQYLIDTNAEEKSAEGIGYYTRMLNIYSQLTE